MSPLHRQEIQRMLGSGSFELNPGCLPAEPGCLSTGADHLPMGSSTHHILPWGLGARDSAMPPALSLPQGGIPREMGTTVYWGLT